LLEYYKNNKANNIKVLIKNVKSGDPSNLEAQGARSYWQGWSDSMQNFRREQTSEDSINAALNYGYIVLRTAVAKTILATGLHTGWGIHHCHPNNTMPLADDLMEPFRPMVDAKVRSLIKKEILTPTTQLNTDIKKSLVDIIYTDILILGEHKPLISYLQTLAYSLVRIYTGEGKILAFPEVKKIQWQDFEYMQSKLAF
jgi:CRISPR-associated protein Cas1